MKNIIGLFIVTFLMCVTARAQFGSGQGSFGTIGNVLVNGVITGNGANITNINAAFFATGTNWANVNVKYVDALHGSDANNGSINFPWATINHAQTNGNTPVGWTIAVNPGTYSDWVTNLVYGWFLASGANVTVYANNGTNTISGTGNITLQGGVAPFNVSITCATFNGYAGDSQANGSFATVHCQTANSIGEGGNGVALSVSDYIIFCDNCYIQNPHFGGSGYPGFEIYANKSMTFTNAANFASGSILQAPTMVTSNTASIFGNDSGITLHFDRMLCNNLDPAFQAGITLTGTLYTDTNVIAPSSFNGGPLQ
jgi:hypothetical protein